MGWKGSQAAAIRTEKTLPKLDDATILMYLILLVLVLNLPRVGRHLRVSVSDSTGNYTVYDN
jgi:hypothetical protein